MGKQNYFFSGITDILILAILCEHDSYVYEIVKFIKEKLEILNKLKGKVYYISGNHDLFYGLEDLKKGLFNFIFMDNICNVIIYKNEIILYDNSLAYP